MKNHSFRIPGHALQVAAVALLGTLAAGNASGADTNFFNTNLMPSPTNGMFVSTQSWVACYANGILISNLAQRLPSACVSPPTPGSPKTNSYTATVELQISMDGGLTWQPVVVTNAGVTVQMGYSNVVGGVTVYTNLMTALNLSGGGLLTGVMIRESPTLASKGETRTQPIQGGYMVSSFFDIYTEISTDYGSTWATSCVPVHVDLEVDPALIPAVAAPRDVLPMPNGQYRTPTLWQFYSNNIVIKNLRQKLFTNWWEPPALCQTQTNTVGLVVDFQYSSDGGVTFTPMRAPAAMTVKITNERGFQGRSTYQTEMTQLSISGGDLPAGVQIRESPTKASKGGTSMVAGGGGGGGGGGAAISSFFDIFTEVSTDSGVSWHGPTNGPAHVELQRVAPVYLYTNNWLPPLNGSFFSPPECYALFPNGVVITNLRNGAFSAAIPPPMPGLTTMHTFNSQAKFNLSQDGGLTFTNVTAPATVTIQITCRLDNDLVTYYYDTEMTQLDISGGSLPPWVMIRESPIKASLGRTTISAGGGGGGGGGYQIDSFFDVFLEVSADGLNWYPCVTGPDTMTLLPQVTIAIRSLNATNVVLTWDNGTLQCSTNVPGVYTNLSGAVSPYTNAVSGARQFFRVRVQ